MHHLERIPIVLLMGAWASRADDNADTMCAALTGGGYVYGDCCFATTGWLNSLWTMKPYSSAEGADAFFSDNHIGPEALYADVSGGALYVSYSTCDDVATPWMLNNGYTCASARASAATSDLFSDSASGKCSLDSSWTARLNCRQSCYDAGLGYDGDVCSAGSGTPPGWRMATCTSEDWDSIQACNIGSGWEASAYGDGSDVAGTLCCIGQDCCDPGTDTRLCRDGAATVGCVLAEEQGGVCIPAASASNSYFLGYKVAEGEEQPSQTVADTQGSPALRPSFATFDQGVPE